MVDSSRAFFLIGPSLSGKSAFIDTLAEKKVVQNIGKVPTSPAAPKINSFRCTYLKQSLTLIEIPSFFDTTLNLPKEKILNQVKSIFLEALSEGFNIKGFILLDPLPSSAFTLEESLNKLKSVCELQSIQSTIVLACKSDLVLSEESYESLAEYCQDQSTQCVKWTNVLNSLTEDEQKRQFKELAEALNSIMPYKTKWMLEMENEIKNIATDLSNDNPRPSPEEIIDKAEELATIEPKISVLKTRTLYRRIEAKLSITALRSLDRTANKGHFKSSLDGDIIYIDEPYTEIYYEMQNPSATSLQAKAQKSLDLIKQSQYLKDAAKIKLQQYKHLIMFS